MATKLDRTEPPIQAKKPAYLLGIDLGAGSLKASIITATGAIAGAASHPVTTSVPHFGFAEQDPAEWVAALCAAVPAAIAAAAIHPAAITGIGISAGAHIPVLLDAHNQVIRPAIMWSDQRSAAEAEALHASAGAMIIEKSLNRVNPTWTLPMLAWLQAHEPDNMARLARLMLAKDYLRFCLTGSWETDFSDIIGALMGDAATQDWSPDICALIGWNMATLPPVKHPTDIIGAVTADAARMTGLAAGTPVICGANDTTAELFGAGAIRPGIGAVKLATAAVLYLATDGPSVQPPVSCYPHIIAGMYYTATGTNSCASAHRWLRDAMFPTGGFAEMDALATTIPPGANGLMFHPYLQGERAPYWDPLLRADFIGATISHTRAHFARALYEGIAYSIADMLQAARGLGLAFGVLRLIGGGARSATWRQIIADVTGLTIEHTQATDASFAAALLAGIGTGVFAGPEDAVQKCVKLVGVTTPDPAAHEIYRIYFAIYRDAQAALAPINHRLHQAGAQRKF